jgi:predicted DNA-binding transcriptional regulator YafY
MNWIPAINVLRFMMPLLGLSIIRIRRQNRQVWLGAAFCGALIAYLLVDFPALRESPFWIFLVAGAFAIPVIFRLLAHALFDDHFKIRWHHFLILASVLVVNYVLLFLKTVSRTPGSLVSVLGVGIVTGSGYHVIDLNPLPQLNLTHTEKLILTLALQNIPLHVDSELRQLADGLLNKLLEQPVESESISLETPPAGRLKGNVFARLQQAIEGHRLVTFLRYRKLDDEVVDGVTVEPYLLYFRERAWYLVAWNPQRAGHRVYRLDRIDKLRVEKETFTPRAFDAPEYFRGTLGAVVGEPQRLRVRFTGLAREIVKKDGRFSPDDLHEENGVLFLDTIIKGEILWLRWILGFGGETEILEPEVMRKAAISMLQAGLQKY